MDSRQRAARDICHILRTAGHRALLAGGCVRDLLLDHPASDYDIATDAPAERVMALFDRTIPVGISFGVVLVVRPEGHFEVATFRRDGPYLDGRHPAHVEFTGEEEDAHRRDFTINALFLDPATDEVLDYVGGREDIRRQIVRTVGNPWDRFQEDYLRMLRAVRFSARLGYAIEAETMRAIGELAPHIHQTSPERIRDELLKMLTEGGAGRALELLDETGLLAEILPEAAATKGVEQPPEYHPEGDVFTHIHIMLSHLERGCSPTLAMAVLLHDIGKPVTQTFEDRIRFNNHDAAGAEMAAKVCSRLRFSNAQTGRILWLIRQHMRVSHLPEMRESKRKRFVREAGFDELMELWRLDSLASHRKRRKLEWTLDYLAQVAPQRVRPEPLLRGGDLKALGYPQGPLYGQMLEAVEDAQLEGEITTKDEAITFVRRRFPQV